MARKPAQGQSPRSSTPKTAQHEQGPVPWPTPPRLSAAINSNKSVYSAPESAYDFKLPETPNDTPSIALPRDEPLTPKSPTSTVTAFTSQTILARSAANANDVEAVNELLQTMKLTLGALGATFDTLGEQTMRVAELGPAIDANHQVRDAPQYCRIVLLSAFCLDQPCEKAA